MSASGGTPHLSSGPFGSGFVSQRHSQKQKPSVHLRHECIQCERKIQKLEKILYVEEEVGRAFCSEACIVQYFTPEIDRLEKEYYQIAGEEGFSSDENRKLSKVRWNTLVQPEEVWREKTLNGDHRYSLITQHQLPKVPVWSVCVCLLLKGEPSFLYLSFLTKRVEVVDFYRRGEQMDSQTLAAPSASAAETGEEAPAEPAQMGDVLADAWTPEETLRAQLVHLRSKDDIPYEDFERYSKCLEATLQVPDEVWTFKRQSREQSPFGMYHFLKRYPNDANPYWYVVIARDTEDEDQIEIVDAFPTRDPYLVERHRVGKLEISNSDQQPIERHWVH